MTSPRPAIDPSHTFLASVTALAVWFTVGCSPTGAPTVVRHESALDAGLAADTERLVGLIHQRLLIMHEVARWKWRHHQPITDPAREAALLKQTGQRARESGLDVELAIAFMKAQIAAGKQIQQQDFSDWQTKPPHQDEKLPDLATELRPKIDQLNKNLLDTLARVAPHFHEEQLQRRLRISAAEERSAAGFGDKIRATACGPLLIDGNREK